MRRHYFGDQAIFCQKDVFWKLGGYKNMDTFEDLEFSLMLKATGKTMFFGPPILSSARRFKKRGAIRQSFSDLFATWKYMRGRKT